MKKVILYIAQSLDGFIAAKDGSVSWLENFESSGFGFKEFYSKIGSIVLGNTTYKQFPDSYKDKPTYVYSRKKKGQKENIIFTNKKPQDLLKSITADKDIFLVGGAKVINLFLNSNAIDEIRLFTMPIILGEGIRLFQGGDFRIDLKIKESKIL